jgi:ABC-type antimicrobial peptide transport system permease subunit
MFVDVGGMTVSERTALQRDIVRRIGDLPAVEAVTWSRRVPFLGTHLRTGRTPTGEREVMSINDGSASYFTATGLPILSGRGFTDAEVEQDAPVVVVSRSLAARMWRGGDPVGRAVDPTSLLGSIDTARVYTVIGVTKDVRSYFLSRLDAPTAYFPTPIATNQGLFLIRTRGNPAAAIRPIRIALGAVSASLPSQSRLVTMTGGPMAVQRLMAQAPATASMALALFGLALASVGVYGLISQIVTRRTREIGVHVALGGRPVQVAAMVVRKTLRPIMWGAGVGLLGAVGVSMLLRSIIATADMPDFTYGGGAFNPMVFGGVLAAVGVVVVAACVIPARRAATVDPMVALRSE